VIIDFLIIRFINQAAFRTFNNVSECVSFLGHQTKRCMKAEFLLSRCLRKITPQSSQEDYGVVPGSDYDQESSALKL
jgi:hypothetical protein